MSLRSHAPVNPSDRLSQVLAIGVLNEQRKLQVSNSNDVSTRLHDLPDLQRLVLENLVVNDPELLQDLVDARGAFVAQKEWEKVAGRFYLQTPDNKLIELEHDFENKRVGINLNKRTDFKAIDIGIPDTLYEDEYEARWQDDEGIGHENLVDDLFFKSYIKVIYIGDTNEQEDMELWWNKDTTTVFQPIGSIWKSDEEIGEEEEDYRNSELSPEEEKVGRRYEASIGDIDVFTNFPLESDDYINAIPPPSLDPNFNISFDENAPGTNSSLELNTSMHFCTFCTLHPAILS